jgi:hypothetical protein
MILLAKASRAGSHTPSRIIVWLRVAQESLESNSREEKIADFHCLSGLAGDLRQLFP